MFVFCLSLLTITRPSPLTNDLSDHWEIFKKLFQRLYNETEEVARRRIFEGNIQQIMLHNLYADLGKHSYRLGINTYIDWTAEEFSRLTNYKSEFNWTVNSTLWEPSGGNYPDEVDWRKEGLVTRVKYQGACGSCWAFSATGSLEGQHKKKTGELVSLSEQNLIDCSTENFGCRGGNHAAAFHYIMANNGIDTEESYPYEGNQRECRFNSTNVGATATGYKKVLPYNVTALMEAVATIGPISVSMHAADSDFLMYKSGVFGKNCSEDPLDHVVLLVGYGTENGKDYWLVKNSWGEGWGEAGYVKIARNENNECGITSAPIYPLV